MHCDTIGPIYRNNTDVGVQDSVYRLYFAVTHMVLSYQNV